MSHVLPALKALTQAPVLEKLWKEKWVGNPLACPVHPKAQLSPEAAGPCQAEEAAWPLKCRHFFLSLDLSSGHALPAMQFLSWGPGNCSALLQHGAQGTPMASFNT